MPPTTLISSAVAGKQSAPKAPPRRRPAGGLSKPSPAPATSKAATPASESTPVRDTTPVREQEQSQPTAHPVRTVQFASPAAGPLSPATTQRATQYRSAHHSSELPASHEPASLEFSNEPPIVHPTPPATITGQPALRSPVQPQLPTFTPVNESPRVPSSPGGLATQYSNKRLAEDSIDAGNTSPSKRIRRHSTQSNDLVQDATNGGVESRATTTPANLPSPRRTRLQQRREQAQETGEAEQIQAYPRIKPRRKRRQKKKVSALVPEEAEATASEADAEATQQHEDDDDADAQQRQPKSRRRKNKGPPVDEHGEEVPDPESHQIDINAVTMFDLGNDTRLGKGSLLEQRMGQIDWAEVNRKRREAADRIFNGGNGNSEHQENDGAQQGGETGNLEKGKEADDDEAGEDNTPAPGDVPAEPPANEVPRAGGGLGFRIINGQIVEDEATMQIDRTAAAAALVADNIEPVEEENDLTARMNRMAWVNARRRDERDRVPAWRSKSDPWTDDQTDDFYTRLEQFGVNFEFIVHFFPGKTRRQIKNKFTREEKLDPLRIEKALRPRPKDAAPPKPIDIEAFAEGIGRSVEFFKFESLAQAEAVIREEFKDKEAAMQEAVRETQEHDRQRAIQAENREKAKENADKRKAERAQMRQMKKRGQKMGAGTF